LGVLVPRSGINWPNREIKALIFFRTRFWWKAIVPTLPRRQTGVDLL
jgi:hypothetical protein